MRLAAALLLLASATGFAATPTLDHRLGDAYRFHQNGWTFVHLDGSPSQIGFQHGYLLAREIEDNVHVYAVEAPNVYKHDWAFFRAAGKTVLWPRLDPEYQQELQGIVDGLHAQGSTLDLWDIVALNGDLELTAYYAPWVDKKTEAANKAAAQPVIPAPSHCSAFIATGSATRDGKIVIAHSNWTSYAEGERWTYAFDITPTHGQHFFMDGSAGVITSADDFGVNASGLMITETTLPTTAAFDPDGIAEFQRSRKAMQYATSIDEYAAIMRKGNNGGYANTWLVGDRKTNQIGFLELGLHHTPLTVKSDGYFVSANFSVDPALIRDDTPGFDPTDMRLSSNARHARADALVQQHYGELDVDFAEHYLADHYDVTSRKVGGALRTLCGHWDQTAEAAPGDTPFDSFGAVSGKVMTSDMAAKLSFIGRAGHPCGEDFIASTFFEKHPEYAWQKPILHDMKGEPWTPLAAGEKPPVTEAALR
jgi:hypothetical protein